MTAPEWDQFFDMMDAWFSGNMTDKKRFAYRLSPLNEHPYHHLMGAAKHLASSGQVWQPTVAELLKSLEMIGHASETRKKCVKCEVGITEQKYRAQVGRCDDCYTVYENAALNQHQRAVDIQKRQLTEARLRLIAYHLDERDTEVTEENVTRLLKVGEWEAKSLVEQFKKPEKVEK